VVQLLDKVSFSEEDGDHLIFTGDLINKGPDSAGVVDLARQHSASCVRGNHEDRVLLLRHDVMASGAMTEAEEVQSQIYSSRELKERALARALTDEQAQWLEDCPVILDVGFVQGIGQLVVVHGGLVPGVDYEKQDPSSVMTMRTIDLDTHVPSPSHDGLNWAKVRAILSLFLSAYANFMLDVRQAPVHFTYESQAVQCGSSFSNHDSYIRTRCQEVSQHPHLY
jgi:3',5'-cyclic AMP phosphodiesterase CpdA